MSSCLPLFWTFFKISLFSIGGGYNMIPLMQHEMAANNWLASGRFLDVLAVSEITPGPMAVNLATFAGFEVAGLVGAMAATLGVCLPGALLLIALGTIGNRLRDHPLFRAAMAGLMPALVGLLAATAIRLGWGLFPEGATRPPTATILIFGIVMGLAAWRNPHPAVLMLGAAAAGLVLSLF